MKSANKEVFKEALKKIRWDEQLGNSENISMYNERFVEGIIKAAKETKVPRYKTYTNEDKGKNDHQLRVLTGKHRKRTQTLQSDYLTKTDKIMLTNKTNERDHKEPARQPTRRRGKKGGRNS